MFTTMLTTASAFAIILQRFLKYKVNYFYKKKKVVIFIGGVKNINGIW